MSILQTPDFDLVLGRFLDDAVHAAMAMQDPIFAQLGRHRLPAGSQGARVQVAGREVVSPEVNMHYGTEVNTSDILEGNFERYHEIVFAIAKTYLGQFMPAFFSHVDDAVEAVGNTMSFNNENLSWDDLFDACEKVEWSVNDDGIVGPPQIVVGPELRDRISALPVTEAQRQRWVSICQAKQEQHVSRRRSRKLR